MDEMDRLMKHFYRMDDYHSAIDAEFQRLAVEPCAKRPKVGDRVLVAAGLLNRGHLWIRLEATVIEEADTSFKIRCFDGHYAKDGFEQWVHQALITDVLTSTTRGPASHDG